MTGSLSVPGWSTRDCQSGFAPDVEILWNPSPNTPERDPDSKWFVASETRPEAQAQEWMMESNPLRYS
jgi:hypothetical protein